MEFLFFLLRLVLFAFLPLKSKIFPAELRFGDVVPIFPVDKDFLLILSILPFALNFLFFVNGTLSFVVVVVISTTLLLSFFVVLLFLVSDGLSTRGGFSGYEV